MHTEHSGTGKSDSEIGFRVAGPDLVQRDACQGCHGKVERRLATASLTTSTACGRPPAQYTPRTQGLASPTLRSASGSPGRLGAQADACEGSHGNVLQVNVPPETSVRSLDRAFAFPFAQK